MSFLTSSYASDVQVHPGVLPAVGSKSTPMSSASQQTPRESCASSVKPEVCTCFAQAVSTFECIEVQLIGGFRHGSTSTDRILQHQKMALARCKGLLNCRECCSQSEFIILIISMCDRMMSSLQRVLPGSGQRSQREMGPGVHPPLEVPNSTGVSIYAGDRPSYDRRRLRMGGWQLDDEDETQVLESLCESRFAQLGRFIDAVGKLVDDKDWPVHANNVRELQERVRATVSSFS